MFFIFGFTLPVLKTLGVDISRIGFELAVKFWILADSDEHKRDNQGWSRDYRARSGNADNDWIY